MALDPLSHQQADLGVQLWNKTGTDAGVRADVGLVRAAGRSVGYAVICTWDDSSGAAARRRVLATMSAIGESLRVHLESPPEPDLA